MEGGQLPSFQPSKNSGEPLLAPAPKFKEQGFAPLQEGRGFIVCLQMILLCCKSNFTYVVQAILPGLAKPTLCFAFPRGAKKVQRRIERRNLPRGWCALPVTVYTHYRCCGASPENFSGFSSLEKSEACKSYQSARQYTLSLKETSGLANANIQLFLIYEVGKYASQRTTGTSILSNLDALRLVLYFCLKF